MGQDRRWCFWMFSVLKSFRSSQFQCLACFYFDILPRSVFQDSEVVIEHFSAKYGAGFHVTGNVYISVGHSVHALPYCNILARCAARCLSFMRFCNFHFGCLVNSHGHVLARHVSSKMLVP